MKLIGVRLYSHTISYSRDVHYTINQLRVINRPNAVMRSAVDRYVWELYA